MGKLESGFMAQQQQPEPWLRGPIEGVDPLVSNLFYTFTQVREELALHLDGLTTEQLWLRPHGTTAAGFHIRHIGGAADRLSAYLRGDAVSPEQLAAMAVESEPGAPPQQLLAELDATLSQVERYVRKIDPEALRTPRSVGRKQLPTTAIGLIVHIAEHSQRHLGQAITTIKLVRAIGGASGAGPAR